MITVSPWAVLMAAACVVAGGIGLYLVGHRAGWAAGENYAWGAFREHLRGLGEWATELQKEYTALEKQYSRILGARGRAGRIVHEQN
jgi:hypothetical protein